MSITQILSRTVPTIGTDLDGSPSPCRHWHLSSQSCSRRGTLSGLLRNREHTPSLVSDDSVMEAMSKNQKKRLARQRRRQQWICGRKEYLHDSGYHWEEVADPGQQETPEMSACYGDLPLLQSHSRPREIRTSFESISADFIGREVLFTARIHIIRRMSAKLVFLVFRQQLTTFQGVLQEEPGTTSVAMVRWAKHLHLDSIVRVCGTIQASKAPVVSCTIHDVELAISKIHQFVHREEPVSFSTYEAEIGTWEEEGFEGRRTHVSDHIRLTNRVLDLRTSTSQSVFRIQSAIGNLFRTFLDGKGFIEIHTPKLQGSATECGADVFCVNYFGRAVYLAQSPQLAKQMTIAADFNRVYEVGPVFRAENSNTHRHLTEYTSLDIEMAIDEHYHEMLELLDATIKNILLGVYSRFRREVEVIKQQFPSDDVVWLDQTPIICFSEGIQMLQDAGWRGEDGKPLRDDKDLHTRDEMRLGKLVKEKFGADYYILDKFPANARPFYTMPNSGDRRFTNSFDIFIRGQEIVSGGQRIHDPTMLEESMRKNGVNADSMQEYVKAFRWGAPPHAGAAVGLERLLMLLLNMNDIRLTSLFYCDPKSFPYKPAAVELRHQESSTIEPPWIRDRLSPTAPDESHLQPLEHLIANYGDATSTSWADERFKIWRDMKTGAAISYVPSSNNYVLVPGNPLCDPQQYTHVISQFLHWLRHSTKYKPIWLLCSPEVEAILGEDFGWHSFSCIAEERVEPSRNLAASDGVIARKIHRSEKGTKLITMNQGEMVTEDVREKIDKRIEDWRSNRKGTQIHLSEIHPWRDHSHRWYFYAVDGSGTVCAFVALATLSPAWGMQIKYSFDFPGSPSGIIERIVTHAIQTAANFGVRSLTFGAGATTTLTSGHNMQRLKVKVLQHTYKALAKRFHLVRKSEFRQKLGALDDPLFISYLPHGLGPMGVRAILYFFIG